MHRELGSDPLSRLALTTLSEQSTLEAILGVSIATYTYHRLKFECSDLLHTGFSSGNFDDIHKHAADAACSAFIVFEPHVRWTVAAATPSPPRVRRLGVSTWTSEVGQTGAHASLNMNEFQQEEAPEEE